MPASPQTDRDLHRDGGRIDGARAGPVRRAVPRGPRSRRWRRDDRGSRHPRRGGRSGVRGPVRAVGSGAADLPHRGIRRRAGSPSARRPRHGTGAARLVRPAAVRRGAAGPGRGRPTPGGPARPRHPGAGVRSGVLARSRRMADGGRLAARRGGADPGPDRLRRDVERDAGQFDARATHHRCGRRGARRRHRDVAPSRCAAALRRRRLGHLRRARRLRRSGGRRRHLVSSVRDDGHVLPRRDQRRLRHGRADRSVARDIGPHRRRGVPARRPARRGHPSTTRAGVPARLPTLVDQLCRRGDRLDDPGQSPAREHVARFAGRIDDRARRRRLLPRPRRAHAAERDLHRLRPVRSPRSSAPPAAASPRSSG